ncbi:uncharacterized protein LOC110981606 [Acanthaster planci]|uniref:Uncharacterized protein LOC110981606 n=1 Tax=Acanthaster planci TaxID=133434 RepID=A0A8B7YNZ5_ACAPL|nr:uncharacterized protein LOC110981606 [Acanthaster planci]
MATMERTHCKICEVHFTSESHAVSHYTGKKHKKKVDYTRPRPAGTGRSRHSPHSSTSEVDADQSPSPNPDVDQSRDSDTSPIRSWQSDFDSPSKPNESGHYYYCKICSKNFSGPAPMKQHMEGSAHEKQLKKVRRAAGISKLQVEDLSAQPRVSNFTGMEPSKKESSLNFQAFPRQAKKSYGPRLRHSGMGSSQFLCGERATIRSDLINICMEKIKFEMSRIIPIIAESVVDAVLNSLPDNAAQETDAGQDVADKPKDNSADMDNTISTHPPMETMKGCRSGDESGVSLDTAYGGKPNHSSAGESAQNSDDDSHPDSQARQKQLQEEMEEVDLEGKKASHAGPDQITGGSSKQGFCYNRGDLGEYSHIENDLDGPRFPGHHGQKQNPNFRNIRSVGSCRGNASDYEEKVGSDGNGGIRLGSQSQQYVDAGLRQTSFSLERAVNEGEENVAMEFGFGELGTEERYCSITSQDLMDFGEQRDLENEQYYPRVSMATNGSNLQQKQVHYTAVQQPYSTRCASTDEHTLTNIPQLKMGSGPPGLQSYAVCLSPHDHPCELCPEEPPEDGETSDVKDLMNVVTEIIRELDIQAQDNTPPYPVHATTTESSMYTITTEP